MALLGLAFKPNTDDMREASSLVLSARLQADGAKVRAYDPVAEDEARKLMVGVEFADSARDALDGADACVIVTEWPEFAELDWNEAATGWPARWSWTAATASTGRGDGRRPRVRGRRAVERQRPLERRLSARGRIFPGVQPRPERARIR